ncbi:RING/Ubox like zinc-binding domain-containing protein [Daldinia grandis]|nr:RING/Ubox like zinc-binding domain-containing protein [Daldinia grandis]
MAPQDSFIDDEEDTCPLCIEEFDLSDRNFRPCPCGYQICQFCYNNLKNNLNGLCPACRRPYDEKDIKWKVVTHEEQNFVPISKRTKRSEHRNNVKKRSRSARPRRKVARIFKASVSYRRTLST